MTSMPLESEPDIELARAQVTDLLARHVRLPEAGAAGADWTVALMRRSTGHGGSLLFAGGPEGGVPAVAAKLYRTPIQARREFRAARAAFSRGVPVAEPLAVFRGTGLIVSRWVPGPTLAAELDAGRGIDVAQQAGRWLRKFHSGSGLRPGLFRPAANLVWLKNLAAEARPHITGSDLAAFDEAVAAVAAAATWQLWSLYRSVHRHGDVTPSNLICSPDGVVGVDLIAGELGPSWPEIARMGVHLGIAALDGPVQTSDPDATRKAFLEGYGLGQGRARKRLAMFEGFDLLRRWRAEVQAATPRPRRVRTLRTLLAQRGFGPRP